MGAWIETLPSVRTCWPIGESPLAWGRGSKHFSILARGLKTVSPLAWGRGSKRYHQRPHARRCRVAPRVGAWIETVTRWRRSSIRTSPLAWGRGSKRLTYDSALEVRMSPLAWGRGSKLSLRRRVMGSAGRPSRGGVDRNFFFARLVALGECRPSRGGVDRNIPECLHGHVLRESPLAWGRGSKQVRLCDQLFQQRRPSRGGVDRNSLING